MNALLDQNIFLQTGLDSASLTQLGAIIHQFTEPGDYRGVALRGGQAEATFTLRVDPASAATQVNIDLATLQASATKSGCCGQAGNPVFTVNPTGYAVFHVSSGAGGYAAHVGKIDRGPQPKSFDSRHLAPGDLFSATIIRPGSYTASAAGVEGECQIVVAYPVRGAKPFQPPAALRVAVSDSGFKPKRVELKPAQGLIFELRQTTSLKIELVTPDDGPQS
ncbi:MAG TPA: hypothetical protein VHU83_19715 [Bryobacteraceae bacterium]|jgi:hypothetical protein|nr:hypothetical protein [Bryobacteraceae bacterium]